MQQSCLWTNRGKRNGRIEHKHRLLSVTGRTVYCVYCVYLYKCAFKTGSGCVFFFAFLPVWFERIAGLCVFCSWWAPGPETVGCIVATPVPETLLQLLHQTVGTKKNKQQFFIHYKETRFKWREMEVTRPTLKLTLASMTSPISWTTGVSLCSFMASQRLAAKTWHAKMNRYLINCTEQNKDQPQQHTL